MVEQGRAKFFYAKPLVIVGGGQVDHAALRRFGELGFGVIAADGGARHCRAVGLVPEAIVGDLDSLEDEQWWRSRTKVVRIEEQETTDFEKSLYSTSAPVTLVVGMTGKRFDHTLAALDALTRYALHRRIILLDEEDLALALAGDFSFTVAPGERVSVHPLAPVKFQRSTGLLYALDGLTLAPGVRTGTSNAATEGAFSLVCEPEGLHGPYLLVVSRSHLEPLLEKLVAQAC